MNLFTYRDLWAWLDDLFRTPPPDEATIRQEVLALAWLDSIRGADPAICPNPSQMS